MKNTFVLKSLLDLFFILLCIMLVLILIVLPIEGVTAKTNITINNNQLAATSFFTWFLIGINIVAYLLFFVGVYFLRKAARFMISKDYYKNEISVNIHKAGFLLLSSGVAHFVAGLAIWGYKLVYKQYLNLGVSEHVVLNFLILIMGVFLLIQADYIKKGKALKQENDLTI